VEELRCLRHQRKFDLVLTCSAPSQKRQISRASGAPQQRISPCRRQEVQLALQ
jgi:hypothetical protein